MENIPNRVVQEEEYISWTAPSRLFKTRANKFMTTPMVVGILVAIILALSGEFMLIAVIGALELAYYAWSTVPPEKANYAITSQGIRIQGRLHGWETLTRWWTVEKMNQVLLMVEEPGSLGGRLILPLGETKTEAVEQVMEKMLIKDIPPETGMDKVGNWLAKTFPLEEEK